MCVYNNGFTYKITRKLNIQCNYLCGKDFQSVRDVDACVRARLIGAIEWPEAISSDNTAFL